MSTVRVAIVEDQRLLLRLLVDAVSAMRGIAVAGAFASAEEALEAELEIDAAILDIRLPGRNGFQLAIELKRRSAATGIVLLSDEAYPGLLASVPRRYAAGWGYLLKEHVDDPDELERAVRVTTAGGIVIDPAVRERMRRGTDGRVADLTDGQWRLLGLLAEGWSNEALARKLVINPKSVENALGRLYLRLGIETTDRALNPRVAAARVFLEDGLLRA